MRTWIVALLVAGLLLVGGHVGSVMAQPDDEVVEATKGTSDFLNFINGVSDTLKKTKANTGVAFSVVENDANVSVTWDIKTWKDGKIAWQGGYRADNEAITAVSYKWFDLSNYKTEVALLKPIECFIQTISVEPYLWVGTGNIQTLAIKDLEDLGETNGGFGSVLIRW